MWNKYSSLLDCITELLTMHRLLRHGFTVIVTTLETVISWHSVESVLSSSKLTNLLVCLDSLDLDWPTKCDNLQTFCAVCEGDLHNVLILTRVTHWWPFQNPIQSEWLLSHCLVVQSFRCVVKSLWWLLFPCSVCCPGEDSFLKCHFYPLTTIYNVCWVKGKTLCLWENYVFYTKLVFHNNCCCHAAVLTDPNSLV